MISSPVVPIESEPQRRELERLEGELASRQSVVHFAHAAVATLIGLMLAGVAGKLLWDLTRSWSEKLGGGVGGASIALLLYAAVSYLRGKRCMVRENQRFERLQALRREMHLDNPAALLPPR